jgi:hypothetical protein
MIAMPLGTFARLTFGSRTFLARSLAGLIDYRHWGQDFTTSTPNNDFTFDQALHNMDSREFRDLLFTENLHEQAIKTVYSWSKGTFRPKTFKPMTFRGVQTLSRASRLTSGSSEPTLEKWRSAVADVLDRQQAQITMDMLKPEGVMTMLLVAPNGSLLDWPNNTAYRAIHDILAILKDRFDADRTKFLTTQTKANIAARDGYDAAEGTPGKHYAYVEKPPRVLTPSPEAPETDATKSETGRLVYSEKGLSEFGGTIFNVYDFGPDYRLDTSERKLAAIRGTPVGVKDYLDEHPTDHHAVYAKFDILPRGNYFQQLTLTPPTATGEELRFKLTYFRANPVRRTDPTGNTGKTVVDTNARFQTDGVKPDMRFRHATTQSTETVADMIANHSSRIDTVDSETQLTLEDNDITSDSLYYVIERVTDGDFNTSTTLKDANGNFTAVGATVAVGDYVMNVATLAKWKITAVVSATELTLASGAANADDVSYVIGRTTAEINAGHATFESNRVHVQLAENDPEDNKDQLLYLVYNALASLPNTPTLAVYPVADDASGLLKRMLIFFGDPEKSGGLWPYGQVSGTAPLNTNPAGYFTPEISLEYLLHFEITSGQGTVAIERNVDNDSSTTQDDDFYCDFFAYDGGPHFDDSGDAPSWRTMRSFTWNRWRDWLYDYMERFWAELYALGGHVDHIFNDNERFFGYGNIDDLRHRGLPDSHNLDIEADAQEQSRRFITKQPCFAVWAPRLGDDIVAALANGEFFDRSSSTDDAGIREDQRRYGMFEAVAQMDHAEYLQRSVYEACRKHFPDVTAGGWISGFRALSLIVEPELTTLGTFDGTHQSTRYYAAAGTADRVGEPHAHWYNLPPKAEDRTWTPQISAKIKHIKREQILDEFDDPTGFGLVTVQVFDEEDVDITNAPGFANNARRGNDQFLEGLKVGHLVRVWDGGGGGNNADAFNVFKPLIKLSKFAVTAVGHVGGIGFESTPNAAGNYVACQYIDTDRDDPIAYVTSVQSRNRGLRLDTSTGWTNFAYNTRVARSMFLASTRPLACFHTTEHSGYLESQQRQYRVEVIFHSFLHGEDRRYWYNIDLNAEYSAGQEADWAAEYMTNDALLELGTVCNLDTTLRPAQLSPLSLNYLRPSMQRCDHIVSGANVRDNRRLFRVTLKDEQLMELNASGIPVRIYDSPPIGPITTSSTDHMDFRTICGHIVRVPGQQVETSEFAVYGWWVIAEKTI